MESSPPSCVDPGAKEEPDPIASASSSSRLSNLSSSSRRLRHVSPPPSSSLRAGIGTSQAQLATPQKSSYSEIFHSVTSTSPALSTDEAPRTSAQSTGAIAHAYKGIRGILFLWKWFCFGYFCVIILLKFRHFTVDWRNSRSVESIGPLMNDPESILSTLPLELRLSKLSSLYLIPLSIEPYILGPRQQHQNTAVACIWTSESGLSLVQGWASSWSVALSASSFWEKGPISLLVTHTAPSHSMAYKELYSRLVSLSQNLPNITFHMQHTSSSLRNFNAYVNIARLFAPSSKVLLFPPSALTLWGPLPQSSAVLVNARKGTHEQFIIPMLPGGLSNTSSLDMPGNGFLPSSALLVDSESASWCTERLFTIANETTQLASISEMALHWQECVWNVWVRSHGKLQVLQDVGWAEAGAQPLPLQFDSLPESVERSLRVRLAQRQRSETCFLVVKEMIALGQWFAVRPSEVGGVAGKDTEYKGDEVKQIQTESAQAKWLRGVCRETLERWGKELILD